MTNNRKVLYDFTEVKIIQSTSLSYKDTNSKWKIETKQYSVEVNGVEIALIDQPSVVLLANAIERIIATAKQTEENEQAPVSIHQTAEIITKETPQF